ncbi:NADH-ubiquinone oxidoreductase assembly factor [Paramyrothecium foliicola]|nr:NADH-ubiquinone oxidoreductase assembly factor [Paramyrothecium foliicola]
MLPVAHSTLVGFRLHSIPSPPSIHLTGARILHNTVPLMSPKNIGPIKQAWYRWKALRLPWRKRFLMGFDLQGNTYWEFRLTRDPESNERWRRIVQYPSSTHHSQVKVSPQWHQWLRHTREDPPALEEQRGDVVRRARMKVLAAEADARWEAKPRVMEDPMATTANRPELQQPAPPLNTTGGERDVRSDGQTAAQERNKSAQEAEDPWAKAKARGPGESWQPNAWDPTAPKKR